MSPDGPGAWWAVFDRVTCTAITKRETVCRQLAAYREKESGDLLCSQHAQIRYEKIKEVRP